MITDQSITAHYPVITDQSITAHYPVITAQCCTIMSVGCEDSWNSSCPSLLEKINSASELYISGWAILVGVQCTLTVYTVHYILYTVHYTVYCTLYTVYCTPYTVRCTLYTVH